MADWTVITDASLDPDAPLTSELAYAWRDNPIAIAEGAAGAPRIQQGALMAPVAGVGVTVQPTTIVVAPVGETVTVNARGKCLMGGGVTVTAVSPSQPGIAAYVLLNGSVVLTVPTGSNSINLTVNYTDVISFRVANTSPSTSAQSCQFRISIGNDAPRVFI